MATTTPRVVAGVQRRRFTVEDYYRMADAGILTEDDRVELIAGEIVEMSPIGQRHVRVINRLNRLLVLQLASTAATVSVQNPVRLSRDGEPQPDLVILRGQDASTTDAANVLLVIEVADSSRDYDRSVKLPLYATAGIPEYWLVDLVSDTIERHTEPQGNHYRQMLTVSKGASLTSTVLPIVTLAVNDILG